ncbi:MULTISPECIES: putative quinol monooxygenase [unclassified Streptomyces]|uniref:putative quinol monooxygenase n=1 Tax=unclassified Streptomyces TaxID=2593676 RepID=UPI00168B6BF0|nr:MULTISPECIES: putative quinol monooxygenase [unclassified Streptomyces]MBD3005388.1 antibiotic biosynthesis monooxygenase [Streptomyces sp. 5-10]
MFALIVSLHVQPGKREEFLRVIQANAEASLRDEPGCLRFDIIEQHDAENRFLLYEVYQDEQAFYEGHRGSAHYARWRERMPHLLVEGGHSNAFGTTIHLSSPETAATS